MLGYFNWLAYFDEAHSASQKNQYCDIKTTLVKTIDKDEVDVLIHIAEKFNSHL